MPVKKPKQELKNLTIKEGSVVERGDNPEAHIMIVKNQEDDRTLVRKLWDWVKGESVEKYMTTSEILAEDRFVSEFSKLRNAFRDAVDMSMWLPMDQMAVNMKKSVDEFTSEANRLMGELEGTAPGTAEALKSIIDDLSAGSDTPSAQGREKFAKAFEALESFSMPKAPQLATETPVAQEKEAKMAQVTKSFEEILKGLSEGDRDTVAAALSDSAAATEKALKEAEEARATNKTLEERLDVLEKGQERTRFVALAKEIIGDAGLSVEDTADTLEAAYGVSKEAGDKLSVILKAASSQAAIDGLTEELGVEGGDAETVGGASAEDQISAIAKKLKEEDPSLSLVQAYNKAADANPTLKAQAMGV